MQNACRRNPDWSFTVFVNCGSAYCTHLPFIMRGCEVSGAGVE